MIRGIHHAGICVSDIERSKQWYCNFLGAQVITDFTVEDQALGRAVNLPGARLKGSMLRWNKTGLDTMIELLQYVEPVGKRYDPRIPMCDLGVTHVAFWTNNAILSLYQELKEKGVWFYSEPQTLKLPGQDVLMCYFKDRDGISLELIGT